MGIALLAVSALAHPLHALNRWWRCQRTLMVARALRPHTSAAAPSQPSENRPFLAKTAGQSATKAVQAVTPKTPHLPLPIALQRSVHLAPRISGAHRPVRVLRRSAVAGAAGRMVIAGRMADVCAELERLVAREAQH